MLAKGCYVYLKSPLCFNNSTLRFSSPHYLDVRQTDLLLVHFQFCLTLHLRNTVNFPLIHKLGYRN